MPTSRSELPAETLRLFAHYSSAALSGPAARDFVILRLAEEGDRRDLRWLAKSVERDEIASTLARYAARQLSPRSRSFWKLVLGAPAGDRSPPGPEPWPR